jgi:hypothetical protein
MNTELPINLRLFEWEDYWYCKVTKEELSQLHSLTSIPVWLPESVSTRCDGQDKA